MSRDVLWEKYLEDTELQAEETEWWEACLWGCTTEEEEKKKKDADKNSIKRKQNIKPLRLTKAVSVRERSKGVSCIWGQYLSFFKISEQLIIVPVFFF